MVYVLNIVGFNPRSRMGSDRSHVVSADAIHLVSIHAPVWGATSMCRTNSTMPGFQSTLPYGERRKGLIALMSPNPVSIHAPVWGATPEAAEKSVNYLVSIHAPVWGATT